MNDSDNNARNADDRPERRAWPDDHVGDDQARAAVDSAASADFTAGTAGSDEEALVLRLKSYEGPLHLLLDLARRQKVDLAEISVLELVEQYLAVIRAARRLKLELAAAWLVMAAWLTLLKSRLLLPTPPAEEEVADAEEMAARLAFRLRRLEAMREAAGKLMSRPRLGLDVHARGMPEPVMVHTRPMFEDNIIDLLSAYAGIVKRQAARREYHVTPPPVWSIHEVRAVLEDIMPEITDWQPLDRLLASAVADGGRWRSALASGLAATLELAREGRLELMQDAPFAPLHVRAGNTGGNDTAAGDKTLHE